MAHVVAFGCNPSFAQASDVFNRLGKEGRWKQLYDGACQKWGHEVFDKGLHGRRAEVGFYASSEKGQDFTAEHLKQPNTLPYYLKLHGVMCAHFTGPLNRTLISAEDTGKLRLPHITVNTKSNFRFISRFYSGKDSAEAWEVEFAKEYLYMVILETIIDCERLQINNPLTFNVRFPDLFFKHHRLEEQEMAHNISRVFEDYEKQMTPLRKDHEDRLQLIKNKTRVIAQFFQRMERRHPVTDGQGRTDLMMLSKMLCEEGLNPAILEYPYFSSFANLEDWTHYLLDGMRAWQKEAGLDTKDLDRILLDLNTQKLRKFRNFLSRFNKKLHL